MHQFVLNHTTSGLSKQTEQRKNVFPAIEKIVEECTTIFTKQPEYSEEKLMGSLLCKKLSLLQKSTYYEEKLKKQ